MMNKEQKVEWRDKVIESLDKSSAVFLANYSGMTVDEMGEFRKGLRAADARFHVVKNTIVKKAVADRGESGLEPLLKGQLGLVFAYGDPAAAAKALSEGAKKCKKLQVVAGSMDKANLELSAIEQLASLPSREALIGQIIGALVAPHRGLVNVLSGVPRQFVQVLGAIKDKKSEAESA